MTVDDETLRAAFFAHTDGAENFTRRMAIAIGDHCGLAPMKVVSRLELMGFLRIGSGAWFRENGGITQKHINRARADCWRCNRPCGRA